MQFCDKRMTRARSFSLPYTCTECVNNRSNYATSANDDINYINSSGKSIVINSETELDIEIESENTNPVDSTDFKDALLASLYSQVEFLRNELSEKNLLIRALVIRCGESENFNPRGNSSCRSDSKITTFSESLSGNGVENNRSNILDMLETRSEIDEDESLPPPPDPEEGDGGDDNLKDATDSPNLNMQFLRDTEQERVKSITLNRQLEEIRTIRHFEYVGRNNENTSVNRDMIRNDKVSWEKGTVLVMGDSTLNGIQ